MCNLPFILWLASFQSIPFRLSVYMLLNESPNPDLLTVFWCQKFVKFCKFFYLKPPLSTVLSSYRGRLQLRLNIFSPSLDPRFWIQIQVNYSRIRIQKRHKIVENYTIQDNTILYYLFCSVSFSSSGSVFSSKMQSGSSGTTSSTSGAGINSWPSSANFSSGPDTTLPPYLHEL